MKPYIILGLLIIFSLLQSCGMFGSAEPEIAEEQSTVTEASTSETQEEPESTVEEIETLKDEEHRQEIEAKEEKIEELLAEQESSEIEEKEELSEEITETEEVPIVAETDETEEPEPAVEETVPDTEPAKDESTEGSSLLGLIFGSDEEDEEKSDTPEDTEEVKEEEEETPSTWSKVQGFFEVSASEDVPDQEEPDTSTVASIKPEDSEDICERAPSLILEMREQLMEMEALHDPRLRDSRNDELFPTIYFDFDQSVIKPDFKDQLQNQAPCVLEQLEKNEDLVVQVEGHADERGNDEYNIALGHRRANSVLGLVKVYVTDPSRIQTISYGEEFPAVQGSNREAWSKNRRVVFTLLLKSQ